MSDIQKPLTKISVVLTAISKAPILVFLIALYLAFVLYVFPNSAYESTAGPLDLKFSYSPDTAYETLDAFGEEGRAKYARGAMTIDFAYPIIYTLMFSVWINLVLKSAPLPQTRQNIVALSPLTVFVFDLTENAGIIALINTYPVRHDALATATSFATTAKWCAAGIVITITIIATAHWAWRSLSSRLSK
jgi:hypothetical protein